jgi:WD40 repeat protein
MGNDTSAMPLRPSQSSPLASLFSPCLTELSVSTVHKDSAIKQAVFVGSCTIATCGDDSNVHLWDAATLAELAMLPAISSKVTIMACVANDKLVTAHESDGGTFLWDLSFRSNPKVLHKLQSISENSDDPSRCVHRIVALESGWFATSYRSVLEDSWLYVWNETGVLVTRIERQDGDKLSDMLYIRVSDCPCLVTCHEPSSNLYIYKNIKEADARKRVSPQIACTELSGAIVMLHKVNHYTFASGSADGTIILWEHVEGASEPQFKPRELRRCESHIKAQNDDWRVRQMVNIYNSAYLLVAVGYGFFIFHVESGAALLQLDYIHDVHISHVAVVVDEDLESVGLLNASSSPAFSKFGDRILDGNSSVKEVAAARCSVDMRSDFERLRKIFLVSVHGNSFFVWRLVEGAYKKTIVLPAANQNPKVKRPKQQPKFKNIVEPEASYRLDAIFVQVFFSLLDIFVALLIHKFLCTELRLPCSY